MQIKKNIISILFFSLLIVIPFILSAQNVEFIKDNFTDKKGFRDAMDNIEQANELFDKGYYSQALTFYMKAQQFNQNNAMLNFRVGYCYLYSNPKTNAISYLEKAFKLDPRVSEKIHFVLGASYQLNLEFDKAIEEFNIHKKTITSSELDALGKEIDKKINECLYGKEMVEKPARAFIDNLGNNVNSQYDDYSPIVNADGSILYFTSRRPTTTGGGKDKLDGDFFEDIYISNFNNGVWSPAVNPGKPLNTDSHDATVGLTPDGQTLLIYKGEKGGDIFETHMDGDKWVKPEILDQPINFLDSKETSAAFSYDGNTIFFVSDREGSIGGKDIYMSTKTQGKWGEAINLGNVINTPYDEDGIFVAADGKTIYFSSRGHKTLGGFDIFKSVNENGKWSEPENLGYPINTPDDDIFFAIDASGKQGFYSTEKAGGFGGKDIYKITFLGPEKPVVFNTEDNLLATLAEPVSEKVIEASVDVKVAPPTLLKGVIMDDASGEPLKAMIQLSDNQKGEVIAIFESNSKTGRYLVSLPSGKNYGIAVKIEGYLFHSENFDVTASNTYKEIIKDIRMKKVEVGTKIVLNNIFFDVGKSTLRPESYAELGILTKLMTDNPTLKIEISGHTDNRGSAQANQKLSENRAKAVVDYLISKKIDATRLTFAGYGLTQPIASNDNEEGRQQNRRTEFKILSK